MGLGQTSIKFDTTLPLVIDIKTQFYVQTGLELYLRANLHVLHLKSNSSDILSLLTQDVDSIKHIEEKLRTLFHKQDYEAMNQLRESRFQFNHIETVQFKAGHFTPLDFGIFDNVITIEVPLIYEYYFLASLEKSLIDLGGYFIDSKGQISNDYPEKWKKLRKWDEYKWYNRPR